MKGIKAGTIWRISKEKETEFKEWLESIKNNPLPNWKRLTKKKWKNFILSTINGLSIKEASKSIGVCAETVYIWRNCLADIFNNEEPRTKAKIKLTNRYVCKIMTREERIIRRWLHCENQSIEEFKNTVSEFKLFVADLIEQPNNFNMKQKSWLTLKEMIITGEKQTEIAKKLNVTKEAISQKIKKLVKFFNLRNSLCDRYKLSKKDAIDIIIESNSMK